VAISQRIYEFLKFLVEAVRRRQKDGRKAGSPEQFNKGDVLLARLRAERANNSVGSSTLIVRVELKRVAQQN
jgi:hypothetical protein